ncbi:NAD(P)/FAD-dependent oxidoreductase [Streptomyces sp. NBC_01264]|uniref:NAD(P)/FAD-dependent oxidoreductase n=1 Tax=Streptomyces sp. NBC_01264 TaxID=2903804 RepID=UPI002255BD31|nr:FAD-dependent monooxygenase [Streptomyces sp. NBC_01264]MCX4782622.1 FAD-dependent monooxygenase [Streptomyces sp. NBC_01264]
MTRAVVLGGGFAGVLVAKVLSRHVDEVTVVEGGRYPAGPGVRPGLPQAFHSHVLVTAGAEALDTVLPGTLEALLARGAHRRGLPDGALILSADGWFRRHETGAFMVSCSRWLLDHVIRQRALADGAVAVRERTRVLGLAGDASRVTGVLVAHEDGSRETLGAELVVDATGRRSRAGRWLTAIGAPAVEEEVVDPGLAYSTRIYRAPPALAADLPAIMVHPRPERGRPGYGATLFPIEDGRWIFTLTGTRAARPPSDEPGFTQCARSLRSPIAAELLAAAEPLGAVRPFRATANRRRYFERLPLPEGFLVIGDALTAVNPVYSHGMSVALLGALRLDRELGERGARPSVLPAVQAAVAEAASESWRMATEQDRARALAEGSGLAEGPAQDSTQGSTDGPAQGPAQGSTQGSADGFTQGPADGSVQGPAAAPLSAAGQRMRARVSRAVLGSPVLMTRLFRAQTLVPSGAALPTPSAGRPAAPPLDTDEAVAQFPGLRDWWFSERGVQPPTPGREP